MREIRPSGLEGGGAVIRSPYPYPGWPSAKTRLKAICGGRTGQRAFEKSKLSKGVKDAMIQTSNMSGSRFQKNFAEFFAGIGLMRMGLERAGWRIAFANDIEEDKWQMYRDHFGDTGEFIVGDIHKLDASLVPDVALATASFPCNDLSLAGARKGLAGEQSSAFWGFVEILTKLGTRRPPLVLLENVTGFLTSPCF
jgi:hypothetical protein